VDPSGSSYALISAGPADYANAEAINASGELCGYLTYTGAQPVVWDSASAAPTFLSDPSGQGAYAWSINNAGDTAGYAVNGQNTLEAVGWNTSGAMTVLGTTAANGGQAECINASDEIGGYTGITSLPGGGEYASVWNGETGAVIWESSNAGSNIVAINYFGASVGDDSSSGVELAAYWSPEGQETLLTGSSGTQESGYTIAINAAGDIIGNEGGAGYLWSNGGASVTPLQLLSTAKESDPQAINAEGDSVGFSNSAAADRIIATYWNAKGEAINLQTLLNKQYGAGSWWDTAAFGINNAGDIVGDGDYKGTYEGFILTPTRASGSITYDAAFHQLSNGSL
jgi:hypothetical protein